MARFDGGRQRVAVWVIDLAVVLALVVLALAVLSATPLGAVIGGELGTRYHREIDRVGFHA
jgi:hypothetical protein